jgi:hypothetical protein
MILTRVVVVVPRHVMLPHDPSIASLHATPPSSASTNILFQQPGGARPMAHRPLAKVEVMHALADRGQRSFQMFMAFSNPVPMHGSKVCLSKRKPS